MSKLTPPIIYKPMWLFPDLATDYFDRLKADLDWERRPDAPREEYYSNDHPVPYTYGRGKGVRTYLPKPWHPAMSNMREVLEGAYHCRFDVCFLNSYLDQRMQLGWHADDSPEIDNDRPIAIISLGAERDIWFRSKEEPADIHKIKLAHGSLCLMLPGMQLSWEHRIPKADRVVGQRISLTYRGYRTLPKAV